MTLTFVSHGNLRNLNPGNKIGKFQKGRSVGLAYPTSFMLLLMENCRNLLAFSSAVPVIIHNLGMINR